MGERKKRGGNGIVLHQRGKVSNCRASKWEIWRNGISKCKLLFVRNYKRCILEQCAMWEKQISGSALETPMQIKYFSQTEHQNIFHCVRTTFGHQRLPFSTKQDLANGWKKLFLEKKKTTQQLAMTRSLFQTLPLVQFECKFFLRSILDWRNILFK